MTIFNTDPSGGLLSELIAHTVLLITLIVRIGGTGWWTICRQENYKIQLPKRKKRVSYSYMQSEICMSL